MLDLGGGYILLRAWEKAASCMCRPKAIALRVYHQEEGQDLSDSYDPLVLRWARLRVPTGQVAWSLWKESLKAIHQVQMARNVKVRVVILYYKSCI